ncbi:hypothetical protein RYJ27_05645 [Microbacterium limosum]|uniref:Uncharacterized protein n=1 Tax=Microbacterium limosum TaxID=3079935 RepID=A0AAU0MKJ2_9MICO|nr:hypothetical protein [Microbacterium sp. Y20]WOQ70677.1 hypothetical protein RYJ27_05645 [Microbacterium sp. Y20]
MGAAPPTALSGHVDAYGEFSTGADAGSCHNLDVLTESRRRVLGVVVLVVVLTGIVGVACVVVVPQVWAASLTTVSEEPRTVELSAGDHRVGARVPSGWALRPVPTDASRLELWSPDGVLHVELRLTDPGDPEALLAETAAGHGPVSTETTAAGGIFVHAETADGSGIAGVVTAGGSRVVVVADETEGYRAEVAMLVAGIGAAT